MGSYRERLLVPVSYWLLAVPSIAFLGAEAWFIAGGIVPPLTLAILSVSVLIRYGGEVSIGHSFFVALGAYALIQNLPALIRSAHHAGCGRRRGPRHRDSGAGFRRS